MYYVYISFEMTKEGVKKNVNNVEDYKPIWDIMAKQWEKHFSRPLFKVGTFLNLKAFYSLRS